MQRYGYTRNGLTINDLASIQSGDYIAVQRVSGFTAPSVRHEEDSIAGNHGIVDHLSYVGGRIITLEGMIKGITQSSHDALVEDLLEAYILPAVPTEESQEKRGYFPLTFTASGETSKFINCKVHAFPRIERTLHTRCSSFFFLQLRCEDPRIYSSSLHVENLQKAVLRSGFPTIFPTMFGVAGYLHQESVQNAGNWEAPIAYRLINSGVTNVATPRLTNVTTGTYQEFNITLLPDEYIDVDTLAGTAVDQDGNDVLPDETNDSEWIWLQKGSNTLRLTSESGNPEIDIEWRDTWISAPR